MQNKLARKAFLKWALLTNLGLLLKPLAVLAETPNKPTPPVSNENVEFIKKGDLQYEKLRHGFNKRINRFPQLIAVCKNVTGISAAIIYAIKNQLPVAVKSGGHCMEGFSSNEGGMVINLSLLNSIEWIDKETVKVGPGCTLSMVYDALIPKGKIIPGGSCGGVGMGGLTLGGGYGLLSRKLGLACDSLLEVTMVDGNGVIRNSKDDPELLWACKGGGNGNFGVIAEMKFKVHPAPQKLESYRFKLYKVSPQKANDCLQQWFREMEQLPNDCFSAFVLNRKTIYILLTNSGKSTGELQGIIKRLSAIADKTSHNRPQPLAAALKVFYGVQQPLYFKNASAGLYKTYNEIAPFIQKALEKVINTRGMIYQVNTLGGKIKDPLLAGSAAFPHRDYTYFSELQTYWETEKQTQSMLDSFREVQEVFNAGGIKAQYRNYPDINFKDWEQLYYGSNYPRLQRIKNRYDPNNLLRHEQTIKNA